MKTPSDEKRTTIKKLTSSLKALMSALVLAGALLFPVSSAHAASNPPSKKSIRDRVGLVRETLKQKAVNDQIPGTRLTFAERALAQWGNWGNWGNWANWNNWNNWRNWGNWGNWGNF